MSKEQKKYDELMEKSNRGEWLSPADEYFLEKVEMSENEHNKIVFTIVNG